MVIVRSVVALAASSGWYIFQMDVHNVFLQGGLNENLYMVVPEIMDEALIVVLVYVDDLLVTSSTLVHIQKTRKILKSKFKMKDLGELKYFLGIGFFRSKKGIYMCQRKYALELVSQMGLSGIKPAETPLEFNHKLTSLEFDKEIKPKNLAHDKLLENRGAYQRIIGKLIYLTLTRTDLLFVVQALSQHMNAPKQSHLDAATGVVRYIKRTTGLDLLLSANGELNLVVYYDSDWASYVETRRSVTGNLVKFGEALIS
ncbi:uncharacterized mitochondrial protein AtMg00810-like [Capsicum annuum]|uniref:uncharacterized mitochondrial protein AtMg00810-like n=1 Tax=Capsicum annuum TaxID=4072 RepID=UPI001FB08F06|nr:uncharacterized mitochondrial protein AtMg00810-like [Capsicum annuum]